MRLVPTAGQAWRAMLPDPKESHRLQADWVTRRWDHVNAETGVPQLPMMDDEDFLQEAKAVAAPDEVKSKFQDGELGIQGPSVVVAGKAMKNISSFLETSNGKKL